MSIFPRLNQRTKIILPIRTNLTTYNEIPEETVISANTEIPSVEDGPTVVARYRNLTVNAGCTLTTQYRCCGLVLVVDGDLTVNGTISMTARGANFQPPSDHRITNKLLPGKEVYYEIDIPATADEIAAFLLKEKRRYHSLDELPAIYRPTLYARGPQGNVYAPADLGVIPAVGGAGGAGRANSTGHGSAGTAGTERKCGGGGGGGLTSGSTGMRGGNGGSGTCYSGGTGGGGSNSSIGGDGSNYGGSGGNGASSHPNYGSGGAGNPGGLPGTTGGSAQSGGTGTGGLLIIVCTGAVVVNGAILSNGAPGGNATLAGGGGSGGGSINIFYGSLTNNGSILASGGTGGVAANVGGAGGNGCITLDQYNF